MRRANYFRQVSRFSFQAKHRATERFHQEPGPIPLRGMGFPGQRLSRCAVKRRIEEAEASIEEVYSHPLRRTARAPSAMTDRIDLPPNPS